MATVDRFTVRVELLPLLAGQFRVREMTLVRPQVNVSIDDAGRLDWLMRQGGEGPLDPDDVSFDRIVINDGRLHFTDARTGGELVFDEIATDLFEGASLAGPWRVRGSMICRADTFCEDGVLTSFNVATGRVAADGSVRVTADVTPQLAGLAGTTVRAEGMVVPDGDLLAYGGGFRMDRTGAANGDPTAGWSAAGDFRLEPRLLTIEALSLESADGRLAFTGNGTLSLGDNAAFDATLTSRQIDLDQQFGAGGVVAVGDAGAELWRGLGGLATPRIPGRISLTIPTVIVSGSLLREVALEAVAGDDWQIESLTAQLPGGTEIRRFEGTFAPGAEPRLSGELEITIEEPSVFAGWRHGRDLSAHVLPPVALNVSVDIGLGRSELQNIALRTGQSALTGAIVWTSAADGTSLNQVTATLVTQSFDVDQLRTLGYLLMGSDFELAEATTAYAIRFEADQLQAGDVTITDVAFDGTAAPEGLTVGGFTIGDAGGARVSLSGTLAHRPEDTPGGDLTLTIDAERLDGLVALAERLAPESGLVDWFAERAPHLAPLNLRVAATGPGENDLAYRFEATGTAADTTFRAEIDLDRGVADWAVGEANIVIDIDAANGAELLSQLGLADPGAVAAGPATIDFNANGVPAGGLTAHLQATLAGMVIASDGRLVTDGINPPRFDGPVSITGDIAPLAALFGYGFPTDAESVPVVLEAEVNAVGREFGARIATSSVAGRSIDGEVQLVETAGGWRLSGDLGVDAADVGWLAAWLLGEAPVPDPANADRPWSEGPLGGPVLTTPAIDLDLAIARLSIGEGLTITNADVGFDLAAGGGGIDLRSGSLSAGIVQSNIDFTFQDGQFALDGDLFLTDIPLETLVWQGGQGPAATGIVTVSANFQSLGRSMGALVAGLNGSGTIGIAEGAFNYFAADAFDRVVDLVDQRGALTGDGLRDAFTAFLDAGTIDFGDHPIAFTIAGGVIAPETMLIAGGGLRLAGEGTIDLNRMALASSWLLTGAGEFDDGPPPAAEITFDGPIGAPVREINVAPLAAYLSLRQLRETERLEAEVLERERFLRIIARMEADRAAAEAAADAAPEPVIELPASPEGAGGAAVASPP
jgi:hypothetical protein